MNNKRRFIFLSLIIVGLILSLKGIYRLHNNKKWVQLHDNMHEADKIEVIGYKTDKIVFENNNNLELFKEKFFPITDVNVNKKIIDQYIVRPFFKVNFFKNGSLLVSIQIFQQSDEIEKDKISEDLNYLTFKIKDNYCIAKIQGKYFTISTMDKDLGDLLETKN
ncbi:hypothetical protein KQI42_12265 [Tissierella sp. MSJ-40]|uniref:Lipoprotein n=1 Tax=Tissierella simiarum TaxID=2841534 RepID=A0ABS6E798_9FIRM|nr:hypothetical protein [Tissierella simiarum]MBU5438793.1 hypothetical protein [Tissierella simiarum]